MTDITTPALLVEKPSGSLSQDMTGFNVLFVHRSIDDMGLSAAAFRVYAHFARRSNSNHHCWPGILETAKTCLLSKNTVTKAIRELEGRAMVVVTRSRGDGNDYFLPGAGSWITLQETNHPKRGNTPRKSASVKDSQPTIPNEGKVNTIPNEGKDLPKVGPPTIPNEGTEVFPLKVNHEVTPIAREGFALISEEPTKKPKPTLEEMIAHAKAREISIQDARELHERWQEAGWLDGNNKPIRNWKSTMTRWKQDGLLPSQRRAKNGCGNRQTAPSTGLIRS